MDLLEIRKKAKGLKDNVQEDAPVAVNPEPDGGEAVPAEKAKAAPRKKAGRKRGAPKKAISEAPVAAWELEGKDAGPDVPASVEAEDVVHPDDGKGREAGGPPVPEAGTPEGLDGSGATGAEDGDEVEYLSFMLADEEYAVKVEDVKEIIRPQRTTMVPRAPDFVVGIISLRGVILPVFNIKRRLGFDDAGRTKTTRVIIVSDGGSPLGIMVDRVTGVARLKKGEIEPPPSVIGGIESEYLQGVGRQGDRLLILFNTQRVLEMEGR